MEMNPPAKRLSIQSPVAPILPTSVPPQAHPQMTPHISANRITQVTPDNTLIQPNRSPQHAAANATTTLPSKEALTTDKPVASVLPPASDNKAIPNVPPSTILQTSETKKTQPVEQTHQNLKSPWSKCVAQLDLETGEVLRVYPSGWYAAKILNVSQGGISQCMNGLRTSCYGFRWRAYEGPSLDCECVFPHFSSPLRI